MATGRYQGGPSYRTPFGKNEWLGSTVGIIHESATCAVSGAPDETIDTFVQKVLQPGQVMAKITSGADIGKVGVYDDAASDGRQTATNIVGINNTFVPWQLNERDVDIDIVKHAWGIANHIFVYEGGLKVALSAATLTLANLNQAGTAASGSAEATVDIKLRQPAADVLGADYGSYPVPS